jgi:non-ribosomal peptide synthetase component E (peptide arylation enzyme)
MSGQVFTVYDMIARGASLHGEAPAVIQGETSLSFQDFKRRVDELAGGLAALGIGKGDRICVLAQNDTAYLVLYGACARWASSPIPSTGGSPRRRWRVWSIAPRPG